MDPEAGVSDLVRAVFSVSLLDARYLLHSVSAVCYEYEAPWSTARLFHPADRPQALSQIRASRSMNQATSPQKLNNLLATIKCRDRGACGADRASSSAHGSSGSCPRKPCMALYDKSLFIEALFSRPTSILCCPCG